MEEETRQTLLEKFTEGLDSVLSEGFVALGEMINEWIHALYGHILNLFKEILELVQLV